MSEWEAAKKFTWLHITDLHVGMQHQNWLWPSVKNQLFDDLALMIDMTGPIDTVIFSGDVVQKGISDEFSAATAVIGELWNCLGKLGSSPSLFVLPGNHDILWPKNLKPELRILKKWWDFQDIHDDFFSDKNSVYRKAAQDLLKNYQNWYAGISPSILGGNVRVNGWLPGDVSTVIEKDGLKVGLLGLNSTWLQIDGDEYSGKLHVDIRQLLKITNDDPVAWCNRNDLNLLITHHPLEWLHNDSIEFWESDINPPGRFDAHLFGHMHTSATRAVSVGGSRERRSVQGASLFGLTQIGNKLDRIHGYSVGRYETNSSRDRARIWPRILQTLESGSRKIVRDSRFELDEADGSYILFSRDKGSRDPDPSDSSKDPSHKSLQVFPTNDSDSILRKVRFHLPTHTAHANVRRVEQQDCLAAMQRERAVWLVSEWGMGADGFLSAVRAARNESDRPIYKIDVSELSNREQLFDTVKRRLDCSLDRFCEIISNDAPNYLLFDNVQISGFDSQDALRPEIELEEVAEVVLEYCPGLRIVFRSRRRPHHASYPVLELRALDEADLRSYVKDHERGGIDLADQSTIVALHRHTDGIPIRVDQALKHLEVVTLAELINSSSDVSIVGAATTSGYPGLFAAVRELAEASDPTQQRAFALLKALSIFPQGEQLARIKRFNNNAPFFAKHATELFDLGFVEVTTLQRLDSPSADAQAKTLVVPRAIRECVRTIIEVDEVREINRKAADLYFGRGWSSGIMKSPSGYRFENPNCPSGDISNANAIIVRLYNDALASDDERGMARALGLARSYLAALAEGDHFHSAVMFCDQLIPNISADRFEDHLAQIKATFGKCLRMIGSHSRAKEILQEVEEYPLSTSNRQSVLLNLALLYENDDEMLACAYARKVIAIDRHSPSSLQAQAIILEFEEDPLLRDRKLAAHEARCRRQKAVVAANNIALSRARSAGSIEEKRRILAPVMVLSRETKDHYNQTRAVIELSKLTLDSGRALGERELSQLINAYHFLFNERIAGIFDRCHDALWQEFATVGDQDNLFSLFRHSSLYWRLRGRDDQEIKYLRKIVGDVHSVAIQNRTRELAYVKARASANGLLELEQPPRQHALPKAAREK